MTRILAALSVLILTCTSPASAQQSLLEPDASVYGADRFSPAELIAMAPMLVAVIRAQGFPCGTVSALRANSLIAGLAVVCDGWLNNYMLESDGVSFKVRREF